MVRNHFHPSLATRPGCLRGAADTVMERELGRRAWTEATAPAQADAAAL